MRWSCPEDRGDLELREERLVCGRCGNSYDASRGFPVFGAGETVEAEPAAFAELLSKMRDASPDEAARAFCDRHGCTRREFGADWSFLLPTRGGGTILELGGGFGDDSRQLVQETRAVVIVPSVANARVLRANLEAEGVRETPVAVLEGTERLPLADGSIAAIAMEDVAAAGFGLSEENLDAVAREWRRVLAPGGTVLVGIKGSLSRVRLLQLARRMLPVPAGSASFNRRVKLIAGGGVETSLRLRPTLRSMAAAGFSPPTIYAPLPDEHRTEIVIPVDDRRVVRYFLNHLIRQNSPAVRLAIHGANLLNRLGLFRHFVPYYYLLFK